MEQQGKGEEEKKKNQSPYFHSIEVMRKDRLFILINVHLKLNPGSWK